MNSASWETVKLPKELIEKIAKIYKDFGYASVPEFIRDAIRRRLEELDSKFIDADSDAEVV